MAAALDSKYLIEQLKLLVQNPDALSHDETQRSEIQRLTRQASVALETTQESMYRTMFAYLGLVTAHISNGFNILSTLAKASEANPVSVGELVEASGLDKYFVSPLMDYHCYAGVAVEPRQGFYAPTKLTHAMMQPMFAAAPHRLPRHRRPCPRRPLQVLQKWARPTRSGHGLPGRPTHHRKLLRLARIAPRAARSALHVHGGDKCRHGSVD